MIRSMKLQRCFRGVARRFKSTFEAVFNVFQCASKRVSGECKAFQFQESSRGFSRQFQGFSWRFRGFRRGFRSFLRDLRDSQAVLQGFRDILRRFKRFQMWSSMRTEVFHNVTRDIGDL